MRSKFTEGSITQHLLTMMFASWLALVSNMLLSLADMYFLSRLNDINVLAAVGFSGSLTMFPISIGIGFSIAISVLVSQALSREGKAQASEIFSSVLYIAGALSIVITSLLMINLPWLLIFLGAQGEVYTLATSYLLITLSSSPLAVLLMAFASGLRSLALAKASMLISLVATLVNIILDPIFIEVLGFGIQGAAWATVIARILAFSVGFWFLRYRLKFIAGVSLERLKKVHASSRTIAWPALISNLVTPIGGLIIVSVVSDFGAEAMAGLAVVGSLSPVLFSVFFSLTGAAGPMVGQNVGVNQPERIAKIYQTGLKILFLYTLFVWILLSTLYPYLLRIFQLEGVAGQLLQLYCYVQVPLSVGLGCIALSNGIYNNLGFSHWSMWLNVIRATAVTYLFCHVGAYYFGVFGAVMASTLSFMVFGVVGIALASVVFRQKYPGFRLIISART